MCSKSVGQHSGLCWLVVVADQGSCGPGVVVDGSLLVADQDSLGLDMVVACLAGGRRLGLA